MMSDIETRAERRLRAWEAAMLFDVEGGTAKAMESLRDRAEQSETYQLSPMSPLTREDYLRETMKRGKRRVRNR